MCSRCGKEPARQGKKLCGICAAYFRGREVNRDRREKNRKQREVLQTWMRDLKLGGACTDCGYQAAAGWEMSWDHLPFTTKHYTIAKLVSDKASRKLIEAELAKCELVCIWCHARREKNRKAFGVTVPTKMLH